MRVGYISNLMIGEDTLGIRGKVWKEYYLETEHSKFCEEHKKQKFENLADINIEVKNYKSFRKDLIEYLDFNPIIKYTDFKKKANKLYYKNKCNFEIKDNTFKNIYYNWRKNS